MEIISIVLFFVFAMTITGWGVALYTNKNLRETLLRTIGDYTKALDNASAQYSVLDGNFLKVQQQLKELETACGKLNPLLTAIRELHLVLFAPYGTHVAPFFNRLWELADLESKGTPKIDDKGYTAQGVKGETDA